MNEKSPRRRRRSPWYRPHALEQTGIGVNGPTTAARRVESPKGAGSACHRSELGGDGQVDDKESDESMTRASPVPTLLDPGWLIPGFPKTANLNQCYRSRPYSAGRLGLIAAYGAFPSDGSDRALGRRFRTANLDAVLIFLAAGCVRVQPHGSAHRVLARNATVRRHQLWRRNPEPALLPFHWS